MGMALNLFSRTRVDRRNAIENKTTHKNMHDKWLLFLHDLCGRRGNSPKYTNEPQHVKTAVILYVNNEGPDQPAHSCRLDRAFIVDLQYH